MNRAKLQNFTRDTTERKIINEQQVNRKNQFPQAASNVVLQFWVCHPLLPKLAHSCKMRKTRQRGAVAV